MLPYEKLDDRSFQDLVAHAREVITQREGAWTDTSPNDPGMVLVEVFAHLTETLLYRVNRIPTNVHLALLNLLGVHINPPAAARVRLDFASEEPVETDKLIPAGTRVTTAQSDKAPVFETVADAVISAGETSTSVDAVNAALVVNEHIGVGNGRSGQIARVTHAPMANVHFSPVRRRELSAEDEQPVIVAVEIEATGTRSGDIVIDDKRFEFWRTTPRFDGSRSPNTCVVDMAAGIIEFSGEDQLAGQDEQVPAPGREIRISYWSGGGPSGNADAGSVTKILSGASGLTVTNPSQAIGGRSIETIDAARERAAASIHSMDACVTRRDYERAACRHAAIARARAMTRADVWNHAQPGEVEVVLVPAIEDSRPIDTALLHLHQEESIRLSVERGLQNRQPLGSRTIVNWANVRTVSVRVSLKIRAEENADAVRQRVTERLHGSISPLATQHSRTGWPFGRDLYASDVFDIVLSEPAVSHIERVRLVVDNVPASDVNAISRDGYQQRTWFVGSGAGLFRTRDDGDSWEALALFSDHAVTSVVTHPERDTERGGPSRAGFVAAVKQATTDGSSQSSVIVSTDLGENWTQVMSFEQKIHAVSWLDVGPQPALLVATETGLFKTTIEADGPIAPVEVDPAQPELGFFDVTAYRVVNGNVEVALASIGRGVYGSRQAGAGGSFERWTSSNATRVLHAEYGSGATLLWTGETLGGTDAAPSVMNRNDAIPAFQQVANGWIGEGCAAISSAGGQLAAGSYSQGVLRLQRSDGEARWIRERIDQGLPIRDDDGFLLEPVSCLGLSNDVTLVGSRRGVFRRSSDEEQYDAAAAEEFADKVNLPAGWLFCSGEHEVTVS